MSETAIEIPLERIDPETLRNMIAEFVTREWSELADADYSLDDKIEQVLQQLKNGQARVMYEVVSETWNIIPVR